MKKKLASYLILACSVFGLAMVGSCKDYEDEFKGYRSEIDNLKKSDGTLKTRIDSISNAVKNIKSCACDPNLKARLDSLYDFLGDIAADSTGLASGYAGGLSYVLNSMNQQIANAASIAYADSVESVLAKKIDELQCFWPDSLYKAYVKSHLVHDSLRLINDSVRLYRDSVAIDSILKRLDAISGTHAKYVDSITLADSIKALEKRYKAADALIRDSVKAIYEKIEEITKRIDTLENRVDSLMDAEKKRITSLYVQGTVNPAFGTFALPMGVRSNILMAYYGEIGQVYFPTTKTQNMVYPEDVITTREAELLSLSSKTQSFEGTIFGDSVGNAGKIYFTVNPNEVELDTTVYHFALQNSLGEAVNASLDSIKPSNEKLTFGFNFNTRAAGDPVALYEAAVTIKADDAQSLKPNVDKDALINIAKDIKNFRDGRSLSSISTSVLKQLDGVLDATALTVNWEDSMGKHYVTSGYDVAVAAVSPLGYGTLQRIMPSTSRRLPANPIDELLSSISAPSVTLNFSDINMDAVSIKIPTVTYTPGVTNQSIKVIIDAKGNGTATTTQKDKDGNPITSDVTMTIKDTVVVSLDSVYINMNSKIDSVMNEVNNTLTSIKVNIDSIVNSIQDQLQSQIDSILQGQNGVKGQLQSNINNMLDDIKSQIGGNQFVSRINSLTNKINKVLDSFDDLSQVVLLYEGEDGALHSMSGSRTIPSVFEGSGSILLYPTSLSAEILTPAYKKYVAVTNVIDASTGKDAKDDKDDTCVSKLIAVNSGDLNTVLEGSTKTVTFSPTAGYIYEVLFSALDYNGDITNRRFYVRVK